VQVIETRMRVQGVDHVDTLSSMADLASTYRDQGYLEKAGKLEKMMHLLERREDGAQITEQEVVQITGYFDKEVMMFLLERRGDDVPIPEQVVEKLAKYYNKEVMTLLLEQRGDDVSITEGVVKAAAENFESGKEVMTLLLERRGDNVPITEGVVKAAARNLRSGKEVITLLLEQRWDNFPITEGVVKEIARFCDEKVMMILLERRGREVLTKAIEKTLKELKIKHKLFIITSNNAKNNSTLY
jgi:hypothetical protein